jgi:succinate dehydrogenase flavin-adding protein (antitoxin of CptAB toxin-antitoxin module)
MLETECILKNFVEEYAFTSYNEEKLTEFNNFLNITDDLALYEIIFGLKDPIKTVKKEKHLQFISDIKCFLKHIIYSKNEFKKLI